MSHFRGSVQFYQQEALGEYLDMHAGRVYYGFDRMQNVVETEVNPALPLLWALDFNVNPMCSVIAQASGEEVVVLDEIVLPRASTKDACEEMARRFPAHGRGLVVYADATGARLQTSGTTDLKILRDFFGDGEYGEVVFKVPKSNPAVRERVALMNGKLESAAGLRMLRVNARCRELIKDLEQVGYKENSLLIDKDKDPKRTHLSDALGYLVWQECRGPEGVGERGMRLL